MSNKKFFLLLILLFVSQSVFAQTGASPWDAALQTFFNFLSGTTGRLLGGIAVAITAISWVFGLFDWRKAGGVIIGLGILFKAEQIVSLFGGAA